MPLLFSVDFDDRHRPTKFPERFAPRVGWRETLAAFIDQQLKIGGQTLHRTRGPAVPSTMPRATPEIGLHRIVYAELDSRWPVVLEFGAILQKHATRHG